MFAGFYNLGASAVAHVTQPRETLAHDTLGFTNAATRTAHDAIRPPHLATPPDSAQKIAILKGFGEWQVDAAHPLGAFAATFDINAPIRNRNGVETRWLDLAAETNDQSFALFLLQNGADPAACLATTQNTLNVAISLHRLMIDLGTLGEQVHDTNIELDETQGNVQLQLQALTMRVDTMATAIGHATTPAELHRNLEAARGRSLGDDLRRLCNPLCLFAVIAGASLYGAARAANLIITSGYLFGQFWGGGAMLSCYLADKIICGGINLVRSGIGLAPMNQRYWLAKTFGGLGCLTALLITAAFTLNPLSQVGRYVFIAAPAYLGANLISYGLEGDLADKQIYEALVKDFEDSQPDMQWQNWKNIGTFTRKMMTVRGFKTPYQASFSIPLPTGVEGPALAIEYPGIHMVPWKFAMRV